LTSAAKQVAALTCFAQAVAGASNWHVSKTVSILIPVILHLGGYL
jgi:hypothetical protein